MEIEVIGNRWRVVYVSLRRCRSLGRRGCRDWIFGLGATLRAAVGHSPTQLTCPPTLPRSLLPGPPLQPSFAALRKPKDVPHPDTTTSPCSAIGESCRDPDAIMEAKVRSFAVGRGWTKWWVVGESYVAQQAF